MNIAWVTTWSRVCGIATYSQSLWPAVSALAAREGGSATIVSLDEFQTASALVARLHDLNPDVVHFQHEYGIWGAKFSPLYRFPSIVRKVRSRVPGARLIATAHTVLQSDFKYPLVGMGWQIPFRFFANQLFLKSLMNIWGPKTWAPLDGVVVHSQQQIPALLRARARASRPDAVQSIPHYVPTSAVAGSVSRETGPVLPALAKLPKAQRAVVVFGFFSQEKGQDVVIEAASKLPSDVTVILAGGLRREEDRPYEARCRARIRELGLEERIVMTGFVESRFLDGLYRRADLVVAPFRETSGSGSLAQAFARGAAVLASDLPLNREIAERQPGALAFFRSGDSQDCARRVQELLSDTAQRESLGTAARRYAEACSPARIAEQHFAFYRSL